MKRLLQILPILTLVILVFYWSRPTIEPQEANYTMGGVSTGLSRDSLMQLLGEEGTLEGNERVFTTFCLICGRRNWEDRKCRVHTEGLSDTVIQDEEVTMILSSQVEQNGSVFLKTGDSLDKVRERLGPRRREDKEGGVLTISLQHRSGWLMVSTKNERVVGLKLSQNLSLGKNPAAPDRDQQIRELLAD